MVDPPDSQFVISWAGDKSGVVVDNHKVPDFRPVSQNGLETMLGVQVPELDESVFGTATHQHAFSQKKKKKNSHWQKNRFVEATPN